MIHALAWSGPQHSGSREPSGRAQKQLAPNFDSADTVAALIQRPLKNYARMTIEARHSLVAAGLALNAARWPQAAEIALLGAGYAGCLEADQTYFRDYAVNGRVLGRGNLFIYTLPTSTLGEIAIPLHLTGPLLHLHSDAQPIATLIRHAELLLADQEAQGALVLWSGPDAAICLAIAPAQTTAASPHPQEIPELSPLDLAHHLDTTMPTEL